MGKEKPGAKPMRSLNDEEYESIFSAAIKKVMMDPPDTVVKTEADDFDAILVEDQLLAKGVDPPLPMAEGSDVDSRESDTMSEEENDESEENLGGVLHELPSLVQLPADNPPKLKKHKLTASQPRATHFTSPTSRTKVVQSKPPALSAQNQGPARQPTFSTKDRKGSLPKFTAQKQKRVRVSKKKLLENRDVEEIGTWVQCGRTSCLKWRHLQEVNDPTLVPEDWNCSMNTDTEHNSCNDPEVYWNRDMERDEFIHTKYAEGSIVWAHIDGYPWWPAMVEIDPDSENFFRCPDFTNVATHYHVVYFDEKVSRAWVGMKAIKPFKADEESENELTFREYMYKGTNHKKKLELARQNALHACSMSLKDRLRKYSFSARYHGRWAHDVIEDSEEDSDSPDKRMPQGRKRKRVAPTPGVITSEDIERLIEEAEGMAEDMLDGESDYSDEDSDECENIAPKKEASKQNHNEKTKEVKEGGTMSRKPVLKAPTFIAPKCQSKTDKVHLSPVILSSSNGDEISVNSKPVFNSEVFTMEMDDTHMYNTNHVTNDSPIKPKKKKLGIQKSASKRKPTSTKTLVSQQNTMKSKSEIAAQNTINAISKKKKKLASFKKPEKPVSTDEVPTSCVTIAPNSMVTDEQFTVKSTEMNEKLKSKSLSGKQKQPKTDIQHQPDLHKDLDKLGKNVEEINETGEVATDSEVGRNLEVTKEESHHSKPSQNKPRKSKIFFAPKSDSQTEPALTQKSPKQVTKLSNGDLKIQTDAAETGMPIAAHKKTKKSKTFAPPKNESQPESDLHKKTANVCDSGNAECEISPDYENKVDKTDTSGTKKTKKSKKFAAPMCESKPKGDTQNIVKKSHIQVATGKCVDNHTDNCDDEMALDLDFELGEEMEKLPAKIADNKPGFGDLNPAAVPVDEDSDFDFEE